MNCIKCGSIKVRSFVDNSHICSLCGASWTTSSSPTIPAPKPILNGTDLPLCGFCGRVMVLHDAVGGVPSFTCKHPDVVVYTTFIVP